MIMMMDGDVIFSSFSQYTKEDLLMQQYSECLSFKTTKPVLQQWEMVFLAPSFGSFKKRNFYPKSSYAYPEKIFHTRHKKPNLHLKKDFFIITGKNIFVNTKFLILAQKFNLLHLRCVWEIVKLFLILANISHYLFV